MPSDGVTEVEQTWWDGQPKRTSLGGTVVADYVHSVVVDGGLKTKHFSGDMANSATPWEETYTDMAGRTKEIARPAAGSATTTVIEQHSYDTRSRLADVTSWVNGAQVTVSRKSDYSNLTNGVRARSGLDLDGGGLAASNAASTDQITETDRTYLLSGASWWDVTTTYGYINVNASRTQLSKTEVLMNPTGPGAAGEILLGQSKTTDAGGRQVVTTVYANRTAQTRRTVIDPNDSSYNGEVIENNGLAVSQKGTTHSFATLYAYDTLGRPTDTTDPRSGMIDRKTYDPATGQVTETSRILAGSTTQVTSYQYYGNGTPGAGQVKKMINPAGQWTRYAYDFRGQLAYQWGTADYPVKYEYDVYGRLWKMGTYRSGSDWAADSDVVPSGGTGFGGAVQMTEWAYYPGDGNLLSKTAPSGAGTDGVTSYDYYANGQTMTKSGRGLTTTYTWSAGNTSPRPAVINFQDASTPDVTFTSHTRDGRPRQVTDGSGTHTFTYKASGALDLDSCTSGILSGVNVDPAYNAYGQRSSLTATQSGTTIGSTVYYGWDSGARPYTIGAASFSSSGALAYFSYHNKSDLPSATTFYNTYPLTLMTTSRTFDGFNRLQSVSNKIGYSSNVINSHVYSYDAAGRRSTATVETGDVWNWGYNSRGEVTDARKFWSGGGYLRGRTFTYGYDNIGNRTTHSSGGTTAGGTTRTTGYTINPDGTNEIQSITNTSAFDVTGLASGVVTVGDNPVDTALMQGGVFHAERNETGEAGKVQPGLRHVVVTAGGYALHGDVYVPEATEATTYDGSGNLTSDSRWTYTWTEDSRLREIATRSTSGIANASAASVRVAFDYDYFGRRVQKRTYLNYNWNTPGSGTLSKAVTYVWDSWNCIAELNGADSKFFLWGPDLSGGNAAGGVSGLLFVQDLSGTYALETNHCVAYDGNGNVAAIVDGMYGYGTVEAAYEYDPFGNAIRQSGPYALINPFRFSTKFTDDESGLVYYGYRYYDPVRGRWPSRDPIEEEVGVNLYESVHNNPINLVDIYGLTGWAPFPGMPLFPGYKGPTKEDTEMFVLMAEIVIPIGAIKAAIDGEFLVTAGELVVGRAKILTKIPGVKSAAGACCQKVKLLISKLKPPFAKVKPNPIPECSDAPKPPAEIFRKGSATDANLTPRPVDKEGLSTTVKPPPGKSQVIDPAKLKQLEAVQDGADHASVRPVDSSRMQEWIDSRGSTIPHDFTQELRDAIIRTEKR